jgi:thiamine-phosphate diphosphorylase
MVKSLQKNNSKMSTRRLLAAAGVDQLIFMTDDKRAPEPAQVVRRLPRGSMVILRDDDHSDRLALAQRLRRVCRTAKCHFLVAGDVALARRVGADGLHLPEHMLRHMQTDLSDFHIVTAACHSRAALRRAEDVGVDFALVSPVFPTESHKNAVPLGTQGLRKIITGARVPIAALGGINHQTAKKLRGLNIAAIAAVSAV